jgi:hypothetical protein
MQCMLQSPWSLICICYIQNSSWWRKFFLIAEKIPVVWICLYMYLYICVTYFNPFITWKASFLFLYLCYCEECCKKYCCGSFMISKTYTPSGISLWVVFVALFFVLIFFAPFKVSHNSWAIKYLFNMFPKDIPDISNIKKSLHECWQGWVNCDMQVLLK